MYILSFRGKLYLSELLSLGSTPVVFFIQTCVHFKNSPLASDTGQVQLLGHHRRRQRQAVNLCTPIHCSIQIHLLSIYVQPNPFFLSASSYLFSHHYTHSTSPGSSLLIFNIQSDVSRNATLSFNPAFIVFITAIRFGTSSRNYLLLLGDQEPELAPERKMQLIF